MFNGNRTLGGQRVGGRGSLGRFVNELGMRHGIGRIELLIQTGGVVVPGNSSEGAYVVLVCHIGDRDHIIMSTSFRGGTGRERDCEFRSHGQSSHGSYTHHMEGDVRSASTSCRDREREKRFTERGYVAKRMRLC